MRRLVIGLALACALDGCVPSHEWTPGPQVAVSDFSRDRARCAMLARDSGGGGFAIGPPAFILGYAVGSVISNTNRAQAEFNDCMELNGWVAER